MANFKSELKDYQVISRELIFDNSLSDRARFVYCYMAAKPEGWNFFLEPMASEIGYSVETLRKYMNELIEHGWLERGKQGNDGGKFSAVEYILKSSPYRNFSDTVNFRDGKNKPQDNIDIIDKRDNKKEEKELKEKFFAFVKLYKKLTNKQTRGLETEFRDFISRHKDWKEVIEILPLAIERETKARNEAKAAKKFFPEPKMLQTYLGRQRAWELYTTEIDTNDGKTYVPSTGGSLNWNDYYNCYVYMGMFIENIADGYTNETRPDGATIMLNNARGFVKWDSKRKQWVETR